MKKAFTLIFLLTFSQFAFLECVVGYYRPTAQWNKGKQEEFKERKTFDVPKSLPVENNGIQKSNVSDSENEKKVDVPVESAAPDIDDTDFEEWKERINEMRS